MVRKAYILLLSLLIFSGTIFGQTLRAYVSINNTTAYIGQPVELKVSVFTTTWFTKGIDVGNIQVDGALTVYFRSLSTSKMINNKRYAGVEFYYNLFPTKEGEIIIPPIDIRVESPKEDDYKGVPRTLNTKRKKITVNSIPLGYDPNNWLVSNSLTIHQKWSQSLKNVKVGDVIQRTISRSVGGTLSEFIPATTWDSIAGISIYPTRPKVNTKKSKTGVSATRIETVNYLFEQEGKITFPTINYVYWNSRTKRFYKKQIDSLTIQVTPNADLAMLKSIKKSLQKEVEAELPKEKKPFLIFGLTLKVFAKYLIFILLGLFALLTILKKGSAYIRIKYAAYLKSESYLFYRVKKSIRKNNYPEFIKMSNSWLSKSYQKQASLIELSKEYDSQTLTEVLNEIDETLFKNKRTVSSTLYNQLLKEIKQLRKKSFTQRNHSSKKENNQWLNPTIR